MNENITFFPVGDGWGYSFEGHYQEFDPAEPGNTVMSRERAEAVAAEVWARTNQAAVQTSTLQDVLPA